MQGTAGEVETKMERSYANSICSIFLPCMELNALEKSVSKHTVAKIKTKICFQNNCLCPVTPLVRFPIIYLPKQPLRFGVHFLDSSQEDDSQFYFLIGERAQSTTILIYFELVVYFKHCR